MSAVAFACPRSTLEVVSVGATQATYLTAGGEDRECPLAVLDALEVAAGQPVRIPPSYAGQRSYPGLFWSTTMGRHLVYESLLELSWLWLNDFDREVVAIAAQPFVLVGADGDRSRTRIPDFLTVYAGGRVVVVDVKPERMFSKPDVRASFAWTARQIEARGWEYLVWSGATPTELRNVRLLAAARRSRFTPDAAIDSAVAACRDVDLPIRTLELALASEHPDTNVRLAVFGALWRGDLRCDMSQPISRETLVSTR